jgi:hypothetical protein
MPSIENARDGAPKEGRQLLDQSWLGSEFEPSAELPR